MNRSARPVIVVILLTSVLFAAQPTTEEDKVWSLEQAYWRYVQANDLERYRSLWHEDFLGWPLSSPEPARKAHITDWITAHTSKGERLKSYDLERLVVQVTGNIATATYRVRQTWVDKDGAGQPDKLGRFLHTWVRNGNGEWQIISGMSAPTDAKGH